MAIAFINQAKNQKNLKSTQRDFEKNCFYTQPIRILILISFECQTIITPPMEKGCWMDRKKSTRIRMPSKRGSFKDLLEIRRLKFLRCFQQGIGNNNLSTYDAKKMVRQYQSSLHQIQDCIIKRDIIASTSTTSCPHQYQKYQLHHAEFAVWDISKVFVDRFTVCFTLVETKEDSESIFPKKNRWDPIKQGHRILICINRPKPNRDRIKKSYCKNATRKWYLVARINLASKWSQRLVNMEWWHPFQGRNGCYINRK